MSHFVLHLPHAASAHEGLLSAGLAHLVEDVSFTTIAAGPDGNPGVLCAWLTSRGHVRAGYHPDLQTWLPAIADGDDLPAGRYWVGTWNDSPPTPKDLARGYPYGGELVTLGDDQPWLFPCALKTPHDMRRKDDGSTEFIPQRKFHQFLIAANQWRETLAEMEVGGKVIWCELRDFMEQALSINYRITPEVADALNLWSHGEHGSVWRAVRACLMPDVSRRASDG